MTATVRAGVFLGGGKAEVREFPMPAPRPGGAVLRVEAVGMCGTDIAQYYGQQGPWAAYPVVPGHEIIGTIDQLGPGSAALDVEEGQRVAVDEVLRCGTCRACLMLQPSCSSIRVYGVTLPVGETSALFGGYGEYMSILPGTVLHPVPDDLPAEDLTLFEPLANALTWVAAVGVRIGETIVVQGPGHQGLAVLEAALLAGAAQVVVTGTARSASRLEVARQVGASATIDVDEEDALERVRELTGGQMADVAFDVTGGSSDTAGLALRLVRAGGRVLLAGQKGGRGLDGVSYDDLVNRGVTLHGGAGCLPSTMPAAIDLLTNGKIHTAALRGAVLSLDSFDEALALLTRSSPQRSATRVSLKHTSR